MKKPEEKQTPTFGEFADVFDSLFGPNAQQEAPMPPTGDAQGRGADAGEAVTPPDASAGKFRGFHGTGEAAPIEEEPPRRPWWKFWGG